jgi:hypothetical protein
MSETCRDSFQNKIEKLVHVVGFIIRISHDVRLHEHKISAFTHRGKRDRLLGMHVKM